MIKSPVTTGLSRYTADFFSLLAGIILAVAVAAAAWLSYRSHSSTDLEVASRQAEDVALVLQAHTRETLRSVDDVVRRVKRTVEREGASTDLARLMQDYRDIEDFIAVVSVADAKGRLILSTLPIPAGTNIADVAHFRAHVAADTGKPFINRPVLGRVSGKWSFHMTRRINRPDGSFGGVAIVAVDLSYWKQLLEEGHFGEVSAIALVGEDGIARAVFGHNSGNEAALMQADWRFLVDAAAADVSIKGRVAASGVPGPGAVTWVYRKLDVFPLLVAVAADENAVAAHLQGMRSWYASGAVIIVLLIGLFTAALLLFFSRQRQHAGERSRMLEAQLKDEERYRRLFDENPVPMMIRDDSTYMILSVNQAMIDKFGYSREEFLGMTALQLQSPATRENFHRELEARESRFARNMRRTLVARDGTELTVDVNAGPLEFEGRAARLIVFNDVSAQIRSEQRFRAIFDYAGVGITMRTVHDRHAPWDVVNDRFCEMTGYTRAELLRMSTADITAEEGHSAAVEDNQRMRAGTTSSYTREKRIVRKDGSLLWVYLSVAVLPDSGGRPDRIIATYQDIHARVLAEERLRESEGWFRAMFNHAGIGISARPVIDRRAPWIAVNDKFCEMTGYSREELLRMSTIDITTPEGQDEALRDNQRLLAGEVSSYVREKQLVCKGGRLLWVTLSVAILPDAEGQPYRVMTTYQDIDARKQAEERLRQSEEHLRAILTAEPECVATVALDGTLIDMNPAGLRMMQAGSLDEMRNWPFLRQVAPQYRRAFVRLQRRIMTGQSGMLEFEAIGIAGKRFWLEIHGAPLHDASGAITALLGIARDVTERRLVREAIAAERNLLRSVIDNLPDRIRVKDRNLKFILGNAAWIKFRAPGLRDVTGLSNHDLFPGDRAAFIDAEDRQVIETGLPSLPREVMDGPPEDQRCYVTTKTPLRDIAGNVSGVISVSRDITDFKRRSLEVEKLNAALEVRVAERTAQLTTANEELEAFASSVSHDLRAPLRQVDGLAAALLEDYSDRLDAPGQGYLSRIRAAAARMGTLIEDLLRLSRVTRVALKLGDVDLSVLARAIFDEVQRDQPSRQVTFRTAATPVVRADPGLLHLALSNLIHNAWKFTGKKAEANIEFGAEQRDGVMVYFVRDDGAGFDMAHAGRLYDAFQRLHAEHEFPGTGIGLAIVRRVMRRHGGDIWAESAVGRGATFYFTLGGAVKAQPPEPAYAIAVEVRDRRVQKAAEPVMPASPRCVLLVDDDPDVLLLASRALAADGYRLITAADGEEALARLREHRVEAVVSDFSMPGA